MHEASRVDWNYELPIEAPSILTEKKDDDMVYTYGDIRTMWVNGNGLCFLGWEWKIIL